MESINPNDNDPCKAFLCTLESSDAHFNWRVLFKDRAPISRFGTYERYQTLLKQANKEGGQVFVTVNKTDGNGQKEENIVKIRALFADLDGVPLSNLDRFEIEPHIVVETSPEKYHAYWLVSDVEVKDFKQLQRKIASICDSDSSVCDPPRIMRVPGFYHLKGEPFLSKVISESHHPRYSKDDITKAIRMAMSVVEDRPVDETFDFDKSLVDGERTRALTYFIGKYIADGLTDEAISALIRVWNKQHQPPLPDQKLLDTLASIRKCDDRNKGKPDVIEEFNRQYAVAPLGGKTVVIRELDDQVDFMTFASFREFHSNKPLINKKPASVYWLTHPERRTYDKVVFNPSDNPEQANAYNLWRGFSVEPIPGDCNLYLDHIENNIAGGNQELFSYILDWMGDSVQNTDRLPGVALVLRGQQGTGKGVFARYFGELFGQHFKHVQSANHLTGQFTKHLADAVIVYADEVVWGGDKQREGILKTLITEPTRLLEAKGKDAITINNYARLILATNESWAVPAGMEERRYCVMEVESSRRQDTQYFSAIARQMESGGKEALLDMLLKRDISGAEIRHFPKTVALLYQKELTLESVPKWWLNCLKLGQIRTHGDQWPEWVATSDLFEIYQENTIRDPYVRGKASSASIFIGQLKHYAPVESARRSSPIQTTFNGDTPRVRGYALPSLEVCREHFEEILGQPVNWSDFE